VHLRPLTPPTLRRGEGSRVPLALPLFPVRTAACPPRAPPSARPLRRSGGQPVGGAVAVRPRRRHRAHLRSGASRRARRRGGRDRSLPRLRRRGPVAARSADLDRPRLAPAAGAAGTRAVRLPAPDFRPGGARSRASMASWSRLARVRGAAAGQSSRIPAMTTASSPLVITADPIGADAPSAPAKAWEAADPGGRPCLVDRCPFDRQRRLDHPRPCG